MSLKEARKLFKEIAPKLKQAGWVEDKRIPSSNPWLLWNERGVEPLSYLVLHGDIDLVEKVLAFHQKTKIEVGLVHALTNIAKSTHPKEWVDLFYKFNVDLNSVNPSFPFSPLMFAVSSSNEELVKALLERGVAPNQSLNGLFSTSVLLTFLDSEESSTTPQVLKALLDHGLDISKPVSRFSNPMETICLKGPQYTRLLLESGVDPNWMNEDAHPLLFSIIRRQFFRDYDVPRTDDLNKDLCLNPDASLEPVAETLIQAGATIDFEIDGQKLGQYNRELKKPFQCIESLYVKSLLKEALPRSSEASKPSSPRL